MQSLCPNDVRFVSVYHFMAAVHLHNFTGRVSHALASNVDWLPTAASLAGLTIPAEHQEGLRGIDISYTFKSSGSSSSRSANAEDAEQEHTQPLHVPPPRPPLYWRGGGGSPPCYDRSPSLAMRDGDWKLLFSPRRLNDPASSPANYRVELYNVSIAALVDDGMDGRVDSSGGAFFEAVNEAKHQPEVVERMIATMMAWHSSTPCPFGNHNNSRQGVCTWIEIPFPGCKAFPFPGMPIKSCRGKPCPAAGTSGPCVCPPKEEGSGSGSSGVVDPLDALYADHLRLLDE